MINGPPEVVRLTVDLHEDVVEMPPPMCPGPHAIDPLPPDFRGEQRSEPIPPEPDGFVAYIDAALMQEVLDIPQRQRKTDVQHDGRANDLRRGFEVAEGRTFCHPATLLRRPARFKRV